MRPGRYVRESVRAGEQADRGQNASMRARTLRPGKCRTAKWGRITIRRFNEARTLRPGKCQPLIHAIFELLASMRPGRYVRESIDARLVSP